MKEEESNVTALELSRYLNDNKKLIEDSRKSVYAIKMKINRLMKIKTKIAKYLANIDKERVKLHKLISIPGISGSPILDCLITKSTSRCKVTGVVSGLKDRYFYHSTKDSSS